MSLIQVSNLTFAYEGSHENIFENVSFQIDTNWRLGFVGRNGRGKTTFLNLLLGKYDYQGSISASVTFSYFPYSVEDKSILAIDAVEAMYPEYEYWKIQREMANLQLDDGVLYRPYDILSNGERTKLQLAVLFSKENNFLLIDEPTNHLDICHQLFLLNYLKPLSAHEKGVHPGVPRPSIPGRLRRPHSLYQQIGYSGLQGKFLHLDGKQAAAGCL